MMMCGKQHRNGQPHQQDEWCLQMLCRPCVPREEA